MIQIILPYAWSANPNHVSDLGKHVGRKEWKEILRIISAFWENCQPKGILWVLKFRKPASDYCFINLPLSLYRNKLDNVKCPVENG